MFQVETQGRGPVGCHDNVFKFKAISKVVLEIAKERSNLTSLCSIIIQYKHVVFERAVFRGHLLGSVVLLRNLRRL